MRKNPLAPLVLVLPFLGGCALCEQITATRVLSANLITTPEMNDPDPTKPAGTVIAERTVLQVLYGDLSNGLDGEAKPVEGATMKLVFPEQPDGLFLVPDPETPGTYCIASDAPDPEAPCATGADERLLYLTEQEYRLQITEEGTDEIREMKVTLPSDSEAALTTAEVLPQAQGADLSIPHPDPENLAFVTVTRFPVVDASGAPTCVIPPEEIGAIVYTNTPMNLEEVKAIIQNDDEWHLDPIVIPGAEAFAGCGTYLVVVSTMARGEAVSTNLFIGSQFLAGRSEAGIYRVP